MSKHSYATSFLPRNAIGDPDYAPWVLTHSDSEALAPERIEALYQEFLKNDWNGSVDVFDDLIWDIEEYFYS